MHHSISDALKKNNKMKNNKSQENLIVIKKSDS